MRRLLHQSIFLYSPIIAGRATDRMTGSRLGEDGIGFAGVKVYDGYYREGFKESEKFRTR